MLKKYRYLIYFIVITATMTALMYFQMKKSIWVGLGITLCEEILWLIVMTIYALIYFYITQYLIKEKFHVLEAKKAPVSFRKKSDAIAYLKASHAVYIKLYHRTWYLKLREIYVEREELKKSS